MAGVEVETQQAHLRSQLTRLESQSRSRFHHFVSVTMQSCFKVVVVQPDQTLMRNGACGVTERLADLVMLRVK